MLFPIIKYDVGTIICLSLDFIFLYKPEFVYVLSGIVRDKSHETICRIINRFHRHVCGHAIVSDNKLLLQRNIIWSNTVEDQLQRSVRDCDNFRGS